ncbi:hypothetical protein PO909_025649 [Leuciscus waleckii]
MHREDLFSDSGKFHHNTIDFLGYIITRRSVQMDQRKVDALRSWPQPTTIKDLQRFLVFANFYHRFISNYSSISSPLTSLLKNRPKSLSWNPLASKAFQQLQEAFCSAPTLVYPDPASPFIVDVDASTTGVGAMLSQQQGDPPILQPFPRTCPQQSGTSTSETVSCWQSNLPWRSGDTSWSGLIISSSGWEIHGKARPDRQVPEGSEETESTSHLLFTLLGLISGAPFEPLQAAELKVLSLKTVLLLALASNKDLHAFSVEESCLEFVPANSHVTLRLRPGYVLKVPTTPFREQVVNLQALPPEEADPALACTWTERKASGPQTSSSSVMEVSRRERLSPSRDINGRFEMGL